MFKKLLIILLALSLFGCANTEDIVEKEYIDPLMDIFLFGEVSSENQKLIKKANGNKEYKNYQFKMIGLDGYDQDLTDIYGNTINLTEYDKYVLEVVSVGCDHCKKIISEYNNSLLNHGIQVIQYFNLGTKQDILDLYDDVGLSIPNDLIIVESNEEFKDYLKNVFKLESYPSLISFIDDKVTFNEYGDINEDELDAFFNLGFTDTLESKIDLKELCSKYRNKDDVKGSLSEENINKIKALDNDGRSLGLTIEIIGSSLDFDDISNKKSSVYVNEIDSYDEYKDSELVLIYTYFSNTQDENKVKFINKLIDSNNSVEYIVVLVEGIDSSSNVYKNMANKFHTKVVSVLGYIPDDFFKIGIAYFPTAFFVEKGTFTGAYCNIDSIDNFNKAIDMFLGDNSIALKSNN